jgi:hypothetical protein
MVFPLSPLFLSTGYWTKGPVYAGQLYHLVHAFNVYFCKDNNNKSVLKETYFFAIKLKQNKTKKSPPKLRKS